MSDATTSPSQIIQLPFSPLQLLVRGLPKFARDQNRNIFPVKETFVLVLNLEYLALAPMELRKPDYTDEKLGTGL